MARVALEQVAAGAVVASDVRDRQGRLLLSAGHELSARTLESLRFWGIASVDVLGDVEPVGGGEAISPEARARAEAETDARFTNAGWPHPFLEVLRGLAVERRARQLAAPGGGA